MLEVKIRNGEEYAEIEVTGHAISQAGEGAECACTCVSAIMVSLAGIAMRDSPDGSADIEMCPGYSRVFFPRSDKIMRDAFAPACRALRWIAHEFPEQVYLKSVPAGE